MSIRARLGTFLTWLAVSALTAATPAFAQSWLDPAWGYRRAVTVQNPGGTTLSGFQTLVTLGAGFDFSHAQSNGADLRVTLADGTTAAPFWIEQWNAPQDTARIWVRIPTLPPGGTTLHLYYGNSSASRASDGPATFEFFEAFEGDSVTGFWNFGPDQTIFVQSQPWETGAPHTLSVVPAPAGAPWVFYGYYGLENCGGIGMAGSNDLANWTKFESNPLFFGGGERWPTVLQSGGQYTMAHTADWCTGSHIVMRTSTDGLAWSAPQDLIPLQPGLRNQNPNLFFDPVDSRYYLYWYRGNDLNDFRIMARSATTLSGLLAAPDQTLITSFQSLAAPSMLYRDGQYFLTAEYFEGVWKTRVYSSPTPTGPFTLMGGNPVLADGDACVFHHPFGHLDYCFYCKQTNGVWTLNLRIVDMNATRPELLVIDPTRWLPFGGAWDPVAATQSDGSAGRVARGNTTGRQVLATNWTANAYILESDVRLEAGRVAGLQVLTQPDGDGVSVNLYEDLDATDNLYVYSWDNTFATTLASAAVGTVSLGQWRKLRVDVTPSQLGLFLDGVPHGVAPLAGSPHSGGGIALYGEQNTSALFNDLRTRKRAAIEPVAIVGPETGPNQAPVVTITSPAEGAFVALGALPLTANVTDDHDAPVALEYRWVVEALDGTGATLDSVVSTTASASYLVTDRPLVTGLAYRVRLSVTDTGGQIGRDTSIARPAIDLSPTSLAVAPVAPTSGDSLTISFQLANLGPASVGPSRWRLLANGTFMAQGDLPVAGGNVSPVTIQVAPLAAGSYTLRAVADVLGAITETNEANNAATLDIEVVAPSDGFPTTGILDDFNRTDGPPGPLWTGDVGAVSITDGAFQLTSSTSALEWVPNVFGSEQEVYFTLPDASLTRASVLLKAAGEEPSRRYIEVRWLPGSVTVFSYESGVGLVQQGAAIPLNLFTRDQFGARARADGRISVYRNHALVGTRTPTSWPYALDGGRIGLVLEGPLVSAVDDFGGGTMLSTTDVPVDVQPTAGARLSAPVPNPTRGPSAIVWTLPYAASGAIDVLDVSGRSIRRLVAGDLPAGPGRATWDGRDSHGELVRAGLYLVRMHAGSTRLTQRLLVMR